jgi:hypothetical protein
VYVHEAGGDQQTLGVDLAAPAADVGVHRSDLVCVDRDISDAARRSGAVDNCTSANDEIVHVDFLLLSDDGFDSMAAKGSRRR